MSILFGPLHRLTHFIPLNYLKGKILQPDTPLTELKEGVKLMLMTTSGISQGVTTACSHATLGPILNIFFEFSRQC